MALGGLGTGQGDDQGLLLAVHLRRGAWAGALAEGGLQPLAGVALAEALDSGQARSRSRGDLFVGLALVGQEQDLMPPPLSPRERVAFQASGQVRPLLVGEPDNSRLAHGPSPR